MHSYMDEYEIRKEVAGESVKEGVPMGNYTKQTEAREERKDMYSHILSRICKNQANPNNDITTN